MCEMQRASRPYAGTEIEGIERGAHQSSRIATLLTGKLGREPHRMWCANFDVEAHPSIAARYQFAHGGQAVEFNGIPAGSGGCFLQAECSQGRI